MEEIIVDEGKIKCLITGKMRKETPEEYVRQEFCRILLDVYNYPKEYIDVEFPIKVGSTDKRVDIVIFNNDIKSQDNISLIVETKKKDEKEGIEQLFSYIAATTSKFGIWTNGNNIKYYYKNLTASNRFDELPDVPKYKESVDAIGQYKKNDLVKCTDLKGVFGRCNNYFFSNQGLTQDKRFSEILKILFCKIEDEKDLFTEKCQFYITPEEQKTDTGMKNFRDRIDTLFIKVKTRFKEDNIFEENDILQLNDRCLSFAVAELQKYSLLETNVDIKGVAFETFVGANLRGEHGEFFTPREIVTMATECIMPKYNEVICDPCCGSGGFLVMALKYIRSQYEKLARSHPNINVDGLFREYSDKCIRGIDFNPDLSRVAKMNMVLNDDGHTGLFHLDSLTPFEEWPEKMKAKIYKGGIDIIMTNPPFGKKCVIDDKKILQHYKLGHKWEKDPQGNWQVTNKIDESRTPDILFIERCLDLLKPGGRMAIVLPDGILGNDGLEYVRHFILTEADIVAIIDCPVESFLPSTDTKTSLLILKKKKSKGLPQTFESFMAIPKSCGHDRRGKELYIRDENGDIVMSNGVPKIDNDFEEVTRRLIEHVKSKNIYD